MVRTCRRRAFLSVVASGTAIGIAGCSSDDGSNGGDETAGSTDGGADGDDGSSDDEDGSESTDGSDDEDDESSDETEQSAGGPTGLVGQFQVNPANTGLVPDAAAQSGLTVDWQYPEQPAAALAGVSYGDGQLYTAFRTESGEQRLVELDGASGDILNERDLATAIMPVYRNGTLYVDGVSGRNRAVLALSPDDFSEQWASSVQLGGTELTVTDDALYGFALDSGNDVVRSIATADGTQRWDTQVTLSGFTTSQPVAVGEDYVFASGDTFNALAKSDGSKQWSATADSPFTSPPLVAEGTVYVGTENGLAKGYDTASGEEVLSVDTPSSFGIEDPFAYADGRLFGLGSFSVFAIDVEPGNVVWQGEPGIGSTLTIAGDHLLGVKTSGQRIVGLNRSDGSVAWQAGPDGGNEGLVGGARAFAVGEQVYAGYNGRVIALS